jgi:anti-sigma B factor antagonist
VDVLGDMTIVVADDRARLTVSGEVDATNAGRLRQTIVDAGIGSDGVVEADLAGVTFMDSTGLRALADAATELSPGELVLFDVPRQLLRILEVTGICKGLRCALSEGI